MRGLVILLIVLAVMGSFLAAAALGNGFLNPKENTKAQEAPKEFKFSTFTTAVCENKKDLVHCKDEVFVNCDGKILKLEEFTDCNGIKFDIPKSTGAAVFGKDWKDPRV